MLSEEKLEKIKVNIEENRIYLINPFTERIRQWISKSDTTTDAFDKYISLFIAFNMFYNLWNRVKNPEKKEIRENDGVKVMNVIELIEPSRFPISKEDIIKLTDILIEDRLVVEIYSWNNKKLVLEGFAQDLLCNNMQNNDKLIHYLIKTLYKIRCNLVHGEKGYEERQLRLLNQSSKILRDLLEQLLTILQNLVHNQSAS
jgi:hypothetical protein